MRTVSPGPIRKSVCALAPLAATSAINAMKTL
jgi:hypothetical protein